MAEVTDQKLLRRAFGAFATGVTVVTVGGDRPHGMTANSFTAVSLVPPLMLICVERDAVMHSALSQSGAFAVSVLAHDQAGVAKHFADRTRPLGLAQFEAVQWQAGRVTGAPLIVGALAHFECRVWRRYNGGDHTVFLGRLLSVARRSDEQALLFLNGKLGPTVHTEGTS
ncbi:MAG TPA: flavin reductase family protein [Micromonosporaceae bacterium]